MSYHNRLHHESRRAQDYEPEDGFGLLRCGLGIIGVIGFAALIWWAVG